MSRNKGNDLDNEGHGSNGFAAQGAGFNGHREAVHQNPIEFKVVTSAVTTGTAAPHAQLQ